MHQAYHNSSSAASIHQTQKKKNKNPFTFLFTRQNKSTSTSQYHLDDEIHKKQGIFGAPLCDASRDGSDLWNLKVPDPVALCFKEINRREGLKTEGIFRLSGATSEVMILENKINLCSPDERKRIDPSEFDIHTLTSLVKKYLRELPEPVIPNAFHEQLQHADLKDTRESIQQLSSILIKLPFYNRQLIHAILIMAAKVQHQVHSNMMCPEALATVFAPVCTGFEQSLRKGSITPSASSSASTAIGITSNKKSHSTPTQTLGKKKHKKVQLPFDLMALQLEQKPTLIEQHIKRNKSWTNIWKIMIEQHEALIDILDKQMHQAIENHQNMAHQQEDLTWKQYRTYYNIQQNQGINRSLPSPFSTNGSMVPLPSDIIMAQFHPIHSYQDESSSFIPVAQPSTYNQQQHYYASNFEDIDEVDDDGSSLISNNQGIHHSLAKKTSVFFQKSNTIRKILSASTLR
ncbi:Rho GTPase activation protein [Gilbertella persicaria]|uniref:Rho GTPase activation protein n=1 Tax=Gilbertella persicaria TaxID=101096 RepID=UPI002220A4A1|nr:Rho GTPase activation protein [Gilbertella persicaria]KAI8076687.1 Rho GTPase activation protein [Gilbertella persicaria]